MEKIIFTDPNDNETEISTENIPQLFGVLIEEFPDYWENGNCSCDFSIYKNDVLIKRLSVGFHEKLGLYLTYEEFYDAIVRTVKKNEKKVRLSEEYLALHKKSQLKKVVEIYNELYVSKGLLMPPELAWKGIESFIKSGERSTELKWITPDEIPKGGNWC